MFREFKLMTLNGFYLYSIYDNYLLIKLYLFGCLKVINSLSATIADLFKHTEMNG
jgi:hypothetical protein